MVDSANEECAIYIDGHKIAYRASQNGEDGVAYMKGNQYAFKKATDFIQDVLSGPKIELQPTR